MYILCVTGLLQDVNRLVATYAFLAASIKHIKRTLKSFISFSITCVVLRIFSLENNLLAHNEYL